MLVEARVSARARGVIFDPDWKFSETWPGETNRTVALEPNGDLNGFGFSNLPIFHVALNLRSRVTIHNGSEAECNTNITTAEFCEVCDSVYDK